MAARYWTGGVRFEMGSVLTGITIEDGAVQAAIPDEGRGVIAIAGPQHVWEQVRSATPPRFLNDINIATGRGGLSWVGDRLTWWHYLPAIQRITELLRRSEEVAPDRGEEGGGGGGW